MDSPENKWNPKIDSKVQDVRMNGTLKLAIAEMKADGKIALQRLPAGANPEPTTRIRCIFPLKNYCNTFSNYVLYLFNIKTVTVEMMNQTT
jgi:hypothetical protein